MNRIPVEVAIKAMREGDVKPRRTHNTYFIKGECGCLLGVMMASKKGRDAAARKFRLLDGFSDASEAFDVPLRYTLGLSDAWEGKTEDPGMGDDYQLGYEDGAAIWKAAVEAGLAEIDPVVE